MSADGVTSLSPHDHLGVAADARHRGPDDLRSQPFGVRLGRDGTLCLSGDIDRAVADQVFQVLVKTTPARPDPVFDVSGVTFIDVSGARAVATAAGQRGPATVRGASAQLRTIWRHAGWSRQFPQVILEDRR